jgi:uncharacterized membrane protein YedE/YeeE
MRWEGHVACLGDRRDAYRVLVGKSEGKNHSEYPDVDERMILRWIFRKWRGGAWTGLIWLGIGTVRGGNCECGNELRVP